VTQNTLLDRQSTVETQISLTSPDAKPAQVRFVDPLIRETPMCACHHCAEDPLLAEGDPAKEVHRCPLSPAERLEPGIIERVAEKCDGIVPERPPSANTQQSVIATLTEGGETYSRMVLAPEEIDDEIVDTFAPFLPDPTPVEKKPYFLDEITIEGDEELQLAIRSLCVEFKHIFSDTLGDLSADIPPFKIEVKKIE
jgi:hypothetical protein